MNDEEIHEEIQSGKVMVQINEEKCAYRTWNDPSINFQIYKGDIKLTPKRWSKHMKQAVRKGILKVVDKHPTGKATSFTPIAHKIDAPREIKVESSGTTTELKKDTIVTLDKKPEEIKFETKEKKSQVESIAEVR